jgi:hypothetical protein
MARMSRICSLRTVRAAACGPAICNSNRVLGGAMPRKMTGQHRDSSRLLILRQISSYIVQCTAGNGTFEINAREVQPTATSAFPGTHRRCPSGRSSHFGTTRLAPLTTHAAVEAAGVRHINSLYTVVSKEGISMPNHKLTRQTIVSRQLAPPFEAWLRKARLSEPREKGALL